MDRRLALLACVALAGCSGSEDKASNGAAAAKEEKAVATAAAPASSVTMQPGEWEMVTQVTEMSMPGMPAGVMPKQAMQKTTVKSCLTPEQTKKPDASFFSGRKDSKCSYKGFEMTAGTVTGTITCPSGEGTQKMTIAGKYEPESYDIEMAMASERMNMKMHTTGKRVGDCPAS